MVDFVTFSSDILVHRWLVQLIGLSRKLRYKLRRSTCDVMRHFSGALLRT